MSSITPSLELPVLVVDKAHWQNQNFNGLEPLEYTITCHTGFLLSIRDFEFTLPKEAEYSSPNIIQIVMDKDRLYGMAFEKGTSVYPVNAENLVPLYGSLPFKRFEPGQKVIVVIGHLAPPGKPLAQAKLTILWAGVVNIQ